MLFERWTLYKLMISIFTCTHTTCILLQHIITYPLWGHRSLPRRLGTHNLRTGLSFSFSSRWHCSARKDPYALRPVSQQSPQGCPRNSANVCLAEHRSFSTLEVECRPLPFSTLLFFRRSVLRCSGLSVFRKFLKPLSTSALSNFRPYARDVDQ